MTRVVLHINRLVLRGVDPADAGAVATALRTELAQLLRADAGATLADRAVLRAGRVHLAPDNPGAALGRSVAARIVHPPTQSGRS